MQFPESPVASCHFAVQALPQLQNCSVHTGWIETLLKMVFGGVKIETAPKKRISDGNAEFTFNFSVFGYRHRLTLFLKCLISSAFKILIRISQLMLLLKQFKRFKKNMDITSINLARDANKQTIHTGEI